VRLIDETLWAAERAEIMRAETIPSEYLLEVFERIAFC